MDEAKNGRLCVRRKARDSSTDKQQRSQHNPHLAERCSKYTSHFNETPTTTAVRHLPNENCNSMTPEKLWSKTPRHRPWSSWRVMKLFSESRLSEALDQTWLHFATGQYQAKNLPNDFLQERELRCERYGFIHWTWQLGSLFEQWGVRAYIAL